MDDAAIVGRLQGPHDLGGHAHRLPPVEPSPALEQLLEALAADELHGEKRPPVLFAEGQEPHDSRVIERLESLDLRLEPARREGSSPSWAVSVLTATTIPEASVAS